MAEPGAMVERSYSYGELKIIEIFGKICRLGCLSLAEPYAPG